MNVNLFELFYNVAQFSSFSEASEKLFISQPAISLQIQKLEKQVGVQLFNRLPNGISLTPEGQNFLHYVENGINNFKDGFLYLKNINGLKYGKIRIGTSATICKNLLMPIIAEFHKIYPQIEIQIISGQSEDLVSQLDYGQIDVLFMTWYKEDGTYQTQKVFEIQDVIIGDKNMYEKTKQGISLAELENMNFIVQTKQSSTRMLMDKVFEKNNFNPKVFTEVVSFDLIAHLVGAGLGVGYSTKQFIDDLLAKQIVYVLNLKQQMPKRNIDMITKKVAIPNVIIEEFKKVVEKFKQ